MQATPKPYNPKPPNPTPLNPNCVEGLWCLRHEVYAGAQGLKLTESMLFRAFWRLSVTELYLGPEVCISFRCL